MSCPQCSGQIKRCPKCNGPLVPLSSVDVKLCIDCPYEKPNPLKEDQKTLIKATR